MLSMPSSKTARKRSVAGCLRMLETAYLSLAVSVLGVALSLVS